MKRIIILICIAILPALSKAQPQNEPAPLTENDKKQTVESLTKLLNEEYIFPDVAEKMITALSANYKKGNYKSISNPIVFAETITRDLIKVSNDRHFLINYDPRGVTESKMVLSKADSLEFEKRDFAEFRKQNFAFKEVKILDGNIGYLNLIGFAPTSFSKETALATMSFLNNTDAIVIDLRSNGGGKSDMVQLLASYFFKAEPISFVEFYTRKGNKTDNDDNLMNLPGKRMPDKDLYILTSHTTFSAAEGFTYLMKNRKRATIIGETTGGGAHPVSQIAIGDKFMIRLPVAKPIDPITKTDWEAVGITPDFEVPVNDALVTAQIKALEKMASATPNNKEYLWKLESLKAKQHPTIIDVQTIQTYAGKYGQRKILFEDGSLYYLKDGQPKRKLIAISQTVFLMEDVDDLRIEMVLENGKVTAMKRLFIDGPPRTDKRSE
jgi:retinol-binding protein 3